MSGKIKNSIFNLIFWWKTEARVSFRFFQLYRRAKLGFDRLVLSTGLYVRKWWRTLWIKKWRFSILMIPLVFIGGIVFYTSFNSAMEWTNQTSFCISCHEMEVNIFEEHKETVHYKNRTGVSATCSDCHVPKEWFPKVIRKIRAASDVYHKILGTINTPEKFRSRRLYLAENVWDEMRANNSRECRNCHSFESMEFDDQNGRARRKHLSADKKGLTCIDCHKGIAHDLPDEDAQETGELGW